MATTELVVVFPVLLLVSLMPVHFALFLHARQMTDLAAAEALDVAVVEGSTEAEAEARAVAILAATGQVVNPVVTVDRTVDEVVVTVAGEARYRLFPGNWTATSRVEGRVERFIGDDER